MKIDSVVAFPMRIRMEDNLQAGSFRYEDYQTVIVKVSCDGVVGWGEAMSRFDPVSTARIVSWIGKSAPREVEHPRGAWEFVWRLFRLRGHTRGIAVEALSGFEIALWDAFGKLEGKPLCRLLAKKQRQSIPAYAGSVFGSRGPIDDQVQRIKELGLLGFKLKVGFGLVRDIEVLSKARGLWNECMLVADANGAYDSKTALKAARSFKKFRLDWFEEPVAPDDLHGYKLLSRSSEVPIGAGETWFHTDFDAPLRFGMIDVVEPSVSRCGGVSVEARVASEAQKMGIKFAPMVGANSSISLAASVHLGAAFGAVAIEYDVFGNPLVDKLTHDFPVVKKGEILVPSRAGLGVEVDEKFVRSMSL